MSRVVASDVVQRRVQTLHTEGDKMVLNTTFDAEDAIEYAKYLRNNWAGNFKGSPELHATLAAVLPMSIWWKLRKEGILQDPVAYQRWLNDNPAFKATEGNALSLVKR